MIFEISIRKRTDRKDSECWTYDIIEELLNTINEESEDDYLTGTRRRCSWRCQMV